MMNFGNCRQVVSEIVVKNYCNKGNGRMRECYQPRTQALSARRVVERAWVRGWNATTSSISFPEPAILGKEREALG